MAEDNVETTQVVICGCGPTGAMLAGYLGQLGVNCVILEKEADIVTDPRGIALDEDGIRYLQGLGIYDPVFSEIGTTMKKFNFVGGTGHDLNVKPFLSFAYSTTEGGTGHPGFMCHKQPVLEKHLRKVISDCESVQLRLEATLCDIREDSDSISVTYIDGSGVKHDIQAKYLVGADGKTGYVRKKYLEPKGITMDDTYFKYKETWVALNWKMKLPTPETHPDFPLWKLGYSPEQVYELFFPDEFRFLCNPNRPSVCGRFGLYEDRLWRFEYVVQAGEEPKAMAEPENMKKIVYPYITHPGSRYGLKYDVIYPEDCIEVLRCRPFRFSARSCSQWALGRAILCGDAAHVFPPFGGQGIASGFRDAIGLAWRLAVASRSGSSQVHEELISGWYTERKQQLDLSLNATVANGNFVTEANPVKIFARDWSLWAAQLVPGVKRRIEMGARSHGMLQYRHEPGLPFLDEYGGGILLPQVYCADYSNEMRFTDDVIFANKSRLFQVVVLLGQVSEIDEAQACLKNIERLSGFHLSLRESTFIVHDSSGYQIYPLQYSYGSVVRTATGGEFAKSPLCRGRPEPLYYDQDRIKKELRGRKYLIVRHDRFVYAACNTQAEIENAAKKVHKLLDI